MEPNHVGCGFLTIPVPGTTSSLQLRCEQGCGSWSVWILSKIELMDTNQGDKIVNKTFQKLSFSLFSFFAWKEEKLFQNRNTGTLRMLQKSNTSLHICLKLRHSEPQHPDPDPNFSETIDPDREVFLNAGYRSVTIAPYWIWYTLWIRNPCFRACCGSGSALFLQAGYGSGWKIGSGTKCMCFRGSKRRPGGFLGPFG